MSNMKMEDSSYGTLERFLYFFLIPFIFTLILLGVLLSFFDNNFMNAVLKTANQIPVVRDIVPEPTAKPGLDDETTTNLAQANKDNAVVITNLNSELTAKNATLSKLTDEAKQKEQLIQELQAQLVDLEEQLQFKSQTDEEYQNQIRQTAGIYANMSASKAAPVIENLTLQERVLILNEMNADARVSILEKMDPKMAAEASILLKDITPVKDKEIAALQARIQELVQNDPNAANQLSSSDIAGTYAAMTPASAANVLLELAGKNQQQVITILSSMQTAPRANVLSAMSNLDKSQTAVIAARLGE